MPRNAPRRPSPVRPVATLAALLAAASAQAAWDAAIDFSTAANPNGVWSYGWSSTLTGAINSFTATDANGNARGWIGSGNSVVWKNFSGSTFVSGSVTALPFQMVQHPGASGEYSIVRFTAPQAGAFNLAYGFIGQDGTSTDVHVLLNGASIFDGAVNGYGNQAGGSALRTLLAGDTVDIRVGFASGGYHFDSTGSNLTITPIPEPASLMVLGLGIGAAVRRRGGSR